MRIGPLATTLGAGVKRFLDAYIALAPADSAGQIAPGFLLARSPAVGTFKGRRLD